MHKLLLILTLCVSLVQGQDFKTGELVTLYRLLAFYGGHFEAGYRGSKYINLIKHQKPNLTYRYMYSKSQNENLFIDTTYSEILREMKLTEKAIQELNSLETPVSLQQTDADTADLIICLINPKAAFFQKNPRIHGLVKPVFEPGDTERVACTYVLLPKKEEPDNKFKGIVYEEIYQAVTFFRDISIVKGTVNLEDKLMRLRARPAKYTRLDAALLNFHLSPNLYNGMSVNEYDSLYHSELEVFKNQFVGNVKEKYTKKEFEALYSLQYTHKSFLLKYIDTVKLKIENQHLLTPSQWQEVEAMLSKLNTLAPHLNIKLVENEENMLLSLRPDNRVPIGTTSNCLNDSLYVAVADLPPNVDVIGYHLMFNLLCGGYHKAIQPIFNTIPSYKKLLQLLYEPCINNCMLDLEYSYFFKE